MHTRSICKAPSPSHCPESGTLRPSGLAGDLKRGENGTQFSGSSSLFWKPEAVTLYYSTSASLKSPLNQSVFASGVLNVPWHLRSSNYNMHMKVIYIFLKPLLRAHFLCPLSKAPSQVVSVW